MHRLKTRAVVAFLLAAALVALPGWILGAQRVSCCGIDCSPCPLSFCKTTRADRALLPALLALAALPALRIERPLAEASALSTGLRALAPHVPGAFQPLRN